MPVYEFRCPTCGPFLLQRPMQETPQVGACPTCAGSAPRSFAVGSAGGPGPLRAAGRVDRARVDRARSGEPVVTGAPTGRRLSRPGGHGH